MLKLGGKRKVYIASQKVDISTAPLGPFQKDT